MPGPMMEGCLHACKVGVLLSYVSPVTYCMAGNKDGDQQQQKGAVVTQTDPQAGQEQ